MSSAVVSSSSAEYWVAPTTLQGSVHGKAASVSRVNSDATWAARVLGVTTTLQASVHDNCNTTGGICSVSFPRWYHLLQHLSLRLRLGWETYPPLLPLLLLMWLRPLLWLRLLLRLLLLYCSLTFFLQVISLFCALFLVTHIAPFFFSLFVILLLLSSVIFFLYFINPARKLY